MALSAPPAPGITNRYQQGGEVDGPKQRSPGSLIAGIRQMTDEATPVVRNFADWVSKLGPWPQVVKGDADDPATVGLVSRMARELGWPESHLTGPNAVNLTDPYNQQYIISDYRNNKRWQERMFEQYGAVDKPSPNLSPAEPYSYGQWRNYQAFQEGGPVTNPRKRAMVGGARSQQEEARARLEREGVSQYQGSSKPSDPDSARLASYLEALAGSPETLDSPTLDKAYFAAASNPLERHQRSPIPRQGADQLKLLAAHARSRNELLQPMGRPTDAGGGEHNVWLSDDGDHVTKETTGGYVPMLDEDLREATPYEYLKRLALAREHFGQQTKFEGITAGRYGVHWIRTSEPRIGVSWSPTDEQVDNYMLDKGFAPDENFMGLWHHPSGTMAHDVNARNFVLDDNGKVKPVDVMLRRDQHSGVQDYQEGGLVPPKSEPSEYPASKTFAEPLAPNELRSLITGGVEPPPGFLQPIARQPEPQAEQPKKAQEQKPPQAEQPKQEQKPFSNAPPVQVEQPAQQQKPFSNAPPVQVEQPAAPVEQPKKPFSTAPPVQIEGQPAPAQKPPPSEQPNRPSVDQVNNFFKANQIQADASKAQFDDQTRSVLIPHPDGSADVYHYDQVLPQGDKAPTTTAAPAADEDYETLPGKIIGNTIHGTHTIAGLNYDGSIDKADNGIGAFTDNQGRRYNTRDQRVKVVMIPGDVLNATFGNFLERHSDGSYSVIGTPEARKIYDAVRSAHVEVPDDKGSIHKFPIGDIQGALASHRGKVIDFSYGAAKEMGYTDNGPVSYQIVGGDGKPYPVPDISKLPAYAGTKRGAGADGGGGGGGGEGGEGLQPMLPGGGSAPPIEKALFEQQITPPGRSAQEFAAPAKPDVGSLAFALPSLGGGGTRAEAELSEPPSAPVGVLFLPRRAAAQGGAAAAEPSALVQALMQRGYTAQQAKDYEQSKQTILPHGPTGQPAPPAAPGGQALALPAPPSAPTGSVTASQAALGDAVKALQTLGIKKGQAQAMLQNVKGNTTEELVQNALRSRQEAKGGAVPKPVLPGAPAAPGPPAAPAPKAPVVLVPGTKEAAPPAHEISATIVHEPTEPTTEGIRPAGSTVGVANPPKRGSLQPLLTEGKLKEAQAQHAAALSPDDPRVKKQADNYTKGEHFVPGDELHEEYLGGLVGGKEGHNRQMLGEGERAIAEKRPMHISYLSSPKEAQLYPTRESRTIQYEAHSPQAREEGLTEAQLVGHTMIPVSVGITMPGKEGDPYKGVINGLSTNVMANNHRHINEKLEAMGRKTPFPKLDQRFFNAMEGYLSNLNAGHTATGQGFQLGSEAYPNEPDLTHIPYRLTRDEADFINLVINNQQAFSKNEQGQALRDLARANGTLITDAGETNRMRHEIEQQDRGWAVRTRGRTPVIEPSIKTFRARLIHEIHPSPEYMPEAIRPGREYQQLAEAFGRTSEHGRPDVAIATSLHHNFEHNKQINSIERDFSEGRITEADARTRLKDLGEDPDAYRYVSGSGGLITPYEENPEAITPQEHSQLKDNLRKQWIAGKMDVEDYRRKTAEVPLPEIAKRKPSIPSEEPETPEPPKSVKPAAEPESPPEEEPETPAPAPVPKPPKVAKPPPAPAAPEPEAEGPPPAPSAGEAVPISQETLAHLGRRPKDKEKAKIWDRFATRLSKQIDPNIAIRLRAARKDNGDLKADNKGNPMFEQESGGYHLANAPMLGEKALGYDAKGSVNKAPEGTVDTVAPGDLEYLNPTDRLRISHLDKVSAITDYADALGKEYERVERDIPDALKAKDWYNDTEGYLKEHFGSDADLVANLLAATSARTGVKVNYGFAMHAYHRYARGDFDRHIDLYGKAHKLRQAEALAEHVAQLADPKTNEPYTPTSEAHAMALYIKHHDILPVQLHGAQFGMNSLPVLKVLARTWLDQLEGPKTRRYTGNMTGQTIQSTGDMWVGRLMRRLGFEGYTKKPWLIQAPAEPGLTNLDFAIQELAHRKAAEKYGFEPRQLQAILWTSEIMHWLKNGWAEGGDPAERDYRPMLKEYQRPEWARRPASSEQSAIAT